MIRSMTGFGKTTAAVSGRKVNIEIRTLNSKQLDVNTRIPSIYRDKESEIRAEINRILERGKIDFMITVDNDADSNEFSINRPLAAKYYSEIKQFAQELGENTGESIILEILKMPDDFKAGREAPDENEWKQVKAAIGEALALTEEFPCSRRRTAG
ncbi:MAG: YicC/YloC family endoribonuclease [Bacteroidales bacterium]